MNFKLEEQHRSGKYFYGDSYRDIKETYQEVSEVEDYCSYSPDILLGVDHSIACKNHDYQYTGLIYSNSRKEADIELRESIRSIYASNGLKLFGLIISWIYYIFVRLFGKSCYKPNRREK